MRRNGALLLCTKRIQPLFPKAHLGQSARIADVPMHTRTSNRLSATPIDDRERHLLVDTSGMRSRQAKESFLERIKSEQDVVDALLAPPNGRLLAIEVKSPELGGGGAVACD